MVGSGYREPPALARRNDGQTFQLTPLLYLVLATVDGRRSYDEVAERVSAAYGRTVTGDNVRSLVDQQLRPLGLLAKEDGSQPEVKKSNPLLALRFKYAVTDPERTRRLTAPFARLFNPVVVALVMAAFLAVSWWVFFRKGLASATYQAFDKPGLLLLVVAVTILSAGFHEFGHAAAARRGGATPGRHGRRDLPGLAGVLHRRHRLLPARPRRARAHRPRRPVLQRDRLRPHRRGVVGHRVRRPAARHRDPDPPDGPPADTARPLRRLPRARRRDRGPRPVPPDQAHPARRAAVALEAPRDAHPQAVGPGRRDGLGARRRPDARVLRVHDGHHAPPAARHGLGRHRQAVHAARSGPGRTPTSSRSPPAASRSSPSRSRSWPPR